MSSTHFAAPNARRRLIQLRTSLRLALTSLLFAAALGAQQGAPPAAVDGSVLIRNVRVFDGERVVPKTSVLVTNGRIARVAPSVSAPSGTPVVDGTGKTLLPGLIDSHTHTWGTALRDDAALGVTTVLDMFTDPKTAAEFRTLDGTPAGRETADFRSAGILATAPKGHGTEYGMPIPTLTSPAEAQTWVDARIAEGSDYIKIVSDDGHTYGIKFPTIDKPTMKALVDAAHARHKLAVVHIGDLAGARDAIDAGADGLAHLFVDRAPDADFAKFVLGHKAFVVPTLSVLESIAYGDGGAQIAKDPKLAPYIRAENAENLQRGFPKRPGPTRDLAFALETVRQLHALGVPLLAGTDALNPGTAYGASMHRELELLVKAGLTPTEALRAATSVPARTFSLADRGRVAPGLRGDLVLVNGDPTADILATRDIVGVWKRGSQIDREAYRAELAKAKAALAAGAFPVPAGSESGDVSDFDGGQPTVKFGSGWLVTTDQLAGGKSVADMKVVPGGANGSAGALEIAGTLDAGLSYGWSGVMFTPGQTAFAPANLSSKKELQFFARGEAGRSYAVLMFARSKGQVPATQRFTTSGEWQEVVLPMASFQGIDGHDLMGVAFVASGTPGPFKLLIDDVKLR
jgi:imidazolonepropionase-like amidohydrolase